MTTPVSSIVWVTVGSVFGSLGAVGLKAGSAHLSKEIRSVLTNWRLAAGISLYLFSTIF
jgi:hypothetical protein